jgi:hypothetical protein
MVPYKHFLDTKEFVFLDSLPKVPHYYEYYKKGQ